MHWPTHPHPVPLNELGWVNTLYLSQSTPRSDPTIIWGTSVEVEQLEAFLTEYGKAERVIVSPAHVLVRAVATALREHPALNRRVIGRRVYDYSDVNVVMPILRTRHGEVDTLFFENADQLSVADVGRRLWSEARDRAVAAAAARAPNSTPRRIPALLQKLRLHWIHRMAGVGFAIFNHLRIPNLFAWHQEMNAANAFVNYLGFPGAPPIISYKPSCLPINAFSLSVTMGPSQPQAVVVDNQIVIRRMAPLFVRVDHRIVNGQQAAGFVSTLRRFVADPWLMTSTDAERPSATEAIPFPRRAAA
jgi:hypothetical protein